MKKIYGSISETLQLEKMLFKNNIDIFINKAINYSNFYSKEQIQLNAHRLITIMPFFNFNFNYYVVNTYIYGKNIKEKNYLAYKIKYIIDDFFKDIKTMQDIPISDVVMPSIFNKFSLTDSTDHERSLALIYWVNKFNEKLVDELYSLN